MTRVLRAAEALQISAVPSAKSSCKGSPTTLCVMPLTLFPVLYSLNISDGYFGNLVTHFGVAPWHKTKESRDRHMTLICAHLLHLEDSLFFDEPKWSE